MSVQVDRCWRCGAPYDPVSWVRMVRLTGWLIGWLWSRGFRVDLISRGFSFRHLFIEIVYPDALDLTKVFRGS